MAPEMKMEQHFDPKRMRQIVNDESYVFHCHHYAALFTQLASDAKLLNGPVLLAEAAEESMYRELNKYLKEKKIDKQGERVSIAEQYFSFVGLGQLKLKDVSEEGGSAELLNSHVDEGWIKKWGKNKVPINYIGQGYIACAFAAITGRKPGSFQVTEDQSIVMGAETSKFSVKAK